MTKSAKVLQINVICLDFNFLVEMLVKVSESEWKLVKVIEG